MRPKCNRCLGLQSTLAPASTITVPLPRLGTTTRIAGRATCESVPMTNMPRAIMAPELPALTTASASPRFIISKATRMDESFLRSAMLGDSCIGTTWDAGAMAICGRTRVLGEFRRDNVGRTDQDNFNAEFLTGEQHPFDHNSGGSVSAHRVNGDLRHSWRKGNLGVFGLDHGAAAVKAAVSAGAMGQHRLAAVSAGTPLRRGQMVMGTALVFHPFRSASFRYRHLIRPIFPRLWRQLLFKKQYFNCPVLTSETPPCADPPSATRRSRIHR